VDYEQNVEREEIGKRDEYPRRPLPVAVWRRPWGRPTGEQRKKCLSRAGIRSLGCLALFFRALVSGGTSPVAAKEIPAGSSFFAPRGDVRRVTRLLAQAPLFLFLPKNMDKRQLQAGWDGWCTCPAESGFDDPFFVADQMCRCGDETSHWHCGACNGRLRLDPVCVHRVAADNAKLVDEASDAFWSVIANAHPAAVSGDLSPLATIQFERAAKAAVCEWIRNNVPDTSTAPALPAETWAVWVTPGDTLYINGPDHMVATLCHNRPPEQVAADARLIAAAPDLRRESQTLYDRIQHYLMGVSDAELPEDLVAAFDSLEAAWHKADGTEPEEDDNN